MHHLLIPYLIIAILFSLFYTKKDENIFQFSFIFLLVISVLFLGFNILYQPIVGDAYRYMLGFEKISLVTFIQMISLDNPEFGFRILAWFTSIFGDVNIFFLILYLLFSYVVYKSLKNIYISYETYIVYMILFLYPYFIFYIFSAKRQGIALVFMLLAISYLLKNQKIKTTIALLISYLFHSSIVLVYPVFIFMMFYKNIDKLFKISLGILLISLISSFLSLNENLNLLTSFFNLDTRYLSYFDNTFENIAYKTGFRIDFVLFSLFPITLYFLFRNQITEDKEVILKWLSLYMLLNSIYHFFSFVVFSDRFAIFSWFILPIVCYEILKRVNNGKYLSIFIVGLIFINILLLQIYTGKTILEIGLF